MISALLLLSAAGVQACDICGCGAGSAYIGILPDFSTHIVGIRYRYNSIRSHVSAPGTVSYLTTTERYHTAELWGGWTFGKKVRVMASLPFSYNRRSSQEEQVSRSGIGDVTVQAFYRLFSGRRTLGEKLLVQDLWIGGGIKLPSGRYEPSDNDAASGKSANLFQLGTGSIDFMLAGMYDLRLQDAGLNIAASYKMNTANSYGYNYGDKLSGTAQFYYKFRTGKQTGLTPNAGMSYERSARDLSHEYPVFTSGGYVLSGMLGAELQHKKIAAGCSWQAPLGQELAKSIVQARDRLMLHIALMF